MSDDGVHDPVSDFSGLIAWLVRGLGRGGGGGGGAVGTPASKQKICKMGCVEANGASTLCKLHIGLTIFVFMFVFGFWGLFFSLVLA